MSGQESQSSPGASRLGLTKLYEKTLEKLHALLEGDACNWSEADEIQIDDLLVKLCVWSVELDVESGSLDWLQDHRVKEASVVMSSLELVRSSIAEIGSLISSEHDTRELKEALKQLSLNVGNICELSSALEISIGLGQNQGPICEVKQHMNDWSRQSTVTEPSSVGDVTSLEDSFGDLQLLLEQPLPPDHDTQAARKSDSPDLLSLLSESQRHDTRGEPFWPEELLKRTMSKDRVLESLDPRAKEYIHHILPPADMTPGLSGQGRMKIYALLTLMERAEQIVEFIEEGLRDQDLPLRFDNKDFFCNGEVVNCFQNWRLFEKAYFEKQQWGFVTPFFQLGPDHSPKHYELDVRTVIPWVHDGTDSALGIPGRSYGGFGDVSRIIIDPDSHALWEPLVELGFDETFFALKATHKRSNDDSFNKELEMLKRFSGRTHEHLVTLLASISHNERQYFLFPYAECNISQFWVMVHPDPPPAEVEEEKWLAKQLLGLVGALRTIHNPDPQGQEEPMYGRHGDIKPENILCYRSTRDPRGVLVLTDFGLSSLDSENSRSNVPNARLEGMTLTYRPPESDMIGSQISRAYDIWGLGCVFLQFVTWFLGGGEFVREFEEQRLTPERTANWMSDIFFHASPVEGEDNYSFSVKPEVTKWIHKLREHPNCTQFIRGVLLLVETKMLVVITDEVKRASSAQLHEKFDKMYRQCVEGTMNKSNDSFLSPFPKQHEGIQALTGLEGKGQGVGDTPGPHDSTPLEQSMDTTGSPGIKEAQKAIAKLRPRNEFGFLRGRLSGHRPGELSLSHLSGTFSPRMSSAA